MTPLCTGWRHPYFQTGLAGDTQRHPSVSILTDEVAQFYSAAISLLDTSQMIKHQSLLSALLTLTQTSNSKPRPNSTSGRRAELWLHRAL